MMDSNIAGGFTGYYHPEYAQALSEFGVPVELPRSGAWFLKREIAGSQDSDGMGCYPFLVCRDWSSLAFDLDSLQNELISFAAAPDPFGNYKLEDLQQAFPDHVVHIKDHYIADLSLPVEQIVSKHHRKHAEKALRKVDVEICSNPSRYLADWVLLFQMAIEQFQISGIRAFSRQSFAQQFSLPGIVISLARHNGNVVAAHVQMVHGEIAYAHLAAQTDDAYVLGAAYALYFEEIRYYQGKVKYLDWGGDAGAFKRDSSLSDFKRGWSTETKPAYFCGRIFNPTRYSDLAHSKCISPGRYFPAYREGEFT